MYGWGAGRTESTIFPHKDTIKSSSHILFREQLESMEGNQENNLPHF